MTIKQEEEKRGTISVNRAEQPAYANVTHNMRDTIKGQGGITSVMYGQK